MPTTDFDQLLIDARQALAAIACGDPSGYKALYSDSEDITLGNPFGGFGRGRDSVYEQLERAASHYRDGETSSFEEIAHSIGPELAYTVEIERFRSKVGGSDHVSDLALRVTCVYRREADGWRLVHRHADPRVDRLPAEAVLHH